MNYEPLVESLAQAIEVLDWDRNTKVMTNKLVTTIKNFNQIINFVSVKQLQEPIQSLATCLQDKLAQVYFGFNDIHKENCVLLNSVQESTEIEAWLLLIFFPCLHNQLIAIHSIFPY